jgi:hypothetical protein
MTVAATEKVQDFVGRWSALSFPAEVVVGEFEVHIDWKELSLVERQVREGTRVKGHVKNQNNMKKICN